MSISAISPSSSASPRTMAVHFNNMDMTPVPAAIQLQKKQYASVSAAPAFLPRYTAHSEVATPILRPVKALTDSQIREKYNQDVSKAYASWLVSAAAIHEQDQCIAEPLARAAFDARTSIKEAAQANTSFIGRAVIWVRNMVSYGASNANFEALSKKKNPEEIAYSAFKTGGGDLGLKDNGFTDIYDTWMAVKHVAPHIYPENINADMINVFKSQAPGETDVMAILAASQGVAP